MEAVAADSHGVIKQTDTQNCKCMTCKKFHTLDQVTKQGLRGNVEIFRCRCCHQMKNRVNIVMSGVPEMYQTGFKALNKEEFNEKAKDLYGDDLKKFIMDEIEEKTKNVVEIGMVGTGKFMDLEDLTDKYKNKQARLKAIIKNTRKIWDPIGECELYEDMEYQSNTSSVESHQFDRTRKYTSEEKQKAAKKQKPAPVVKKEDGKTDSTVTVSGKQVETLTKLKSKLEEVDVSLEEKLKEASQLADFMPPYISKNGGEASQALKDAIGRVDIVIEQKTVVGKSFKDFMRGIEEDKKASKEMLRRITVQVQESESARKAK